MGIRWKLADLIRNQEQQERRIITLREISEATGISVPVLSNLCSPRKCYVTNTRTLAILKQYFNCQWPDLMDETLIPEEHEKDETFQ